MHESLTSKTHELLSVSSANDTLVGDDSSGSLPVEKDFGEVDLRQDPLNAHL